MEVTEKAIITTFAILLFFVGVMVYNLPEGKPIASVPFLGSAVISYLFIKSETKNNG